MSGTTRIKNGCETRKFLMTMRQQISAGTSQGPRTKGKPKKNYTIGTKMNTQNHLPKIAYGVTQELSMQTISKAISISTSTIILLAALISPTAVADNLVLPSAQGTRVVIDVKKQQVLAKDKERNISYSIDNAITRHIIRAEDIQLIANESKPEAQLFIVLAREPSRPSAMGQGYCGAGYEDYLLLVEMLGHKLILRDQFLLQSCLKSISMFIDQGDDNPSNGLVHGKDGSFTYRLVDDDYDKKRTIIISKKHFEIKPPSPTNQ